ncbi:uncharacterized membrane protein YgdD (TMEM256/DUF423 family) [Herbaspirillum sp. Sphag1AN]|uniref:DUF423 domain-containing protein n=1 Tax=unclassified Herbaspirillum TaxID=2624150 RepID=UPI00160FD185|nr:MULTISPECIES: DUF423 domain-containing protein [unclassified Herbaspirillum]MBB3211336.1 uncharacterized membrane protein YgdD (TMEM256/DUF423 family) [Herbaspirillum sp. Sphag1AN]MBB3245397.1 uncharacterized membrane protein YgdD (TMEM256/DUF423 family) [Herbaspirillum sp. Sphag64]
MSERLLVILAAINMFIAVAAGAFGAHGLKQVLDSEMLAIWHTAVTYQMMHALGMFLIALLIPKFSSMLLGWAGSAMFVGIVIFSGSLYALALSGIRLLGAITPIGGLAFLASWILVAWAAYKGNAGSM